jgi:hypothetical protein
MTVDFKDRLAKIRMRNLKVKHEKNASWPVEKKIEVVSQWLVLGNLRMVSAITGVSYSLVRQWKQQPWWAELVAEIRQTQTIEMDTKLSKIVDKSLDAVLDRVENGDFFFDQKAQEVKRKPVALRDVARVTVDILAKRELLRGNATERKETTQVSVTDQLKLLAAEFAKWQSKPQEVIDVEMVEVIDVEDQGNPSGEVVEDTEPTSEVHASDESEGLGLVTEDEQDTELGTLQMGVGESRDNS